MIPRRGSHFLIPLGLVLSLAVSGCMERSLEITSEPSGATVLVNEAKVGQTPYTYRFKHYGTFDIRLEKKGYQSMGRTPRTPSRREA